jgi:competence protein ComEC
MRLPAVAIASAFVLGISLGFCRTVSSHASSHLFVAFLFVAAGTSLLLGILFVYFQRLAWAASAALVCWAVLGVAGVCLDEQPRRTDHILALADAGKVDLRSPLRFHGRLRDEPEKLPWGSGYEIELSGVESEGALLPASGGLRFSFAPHAKDQHTIAALHVGDAIAVLTQAKRPQVYRDEGAFDRRAYLAQHGVDLVATLRAAELLEVREAARPSFRFWVPRARHKLRDTVDALWAANPDVAGVMRAMLLGDRNFVDREEAQDFQKTGTFHVLVVAGLHVGAIALVLYWVGRKLRIARALTVVITLAMLLAYVAVVEQRTPVLRAALMTGIVVLGGLFYRRLELLNSAAIAALILLVAKPAALGDASFLLSFLAVGCIAALALPWLERTVQPYVRALRGWRDVTRDGSHEPLAAQFRIDLRATARFFELRLPSRMAKAPGSVMVGGLAGAFRVWELLVLTLVLQIGMLPMLAAEFHRIMFAGPVVNFVAVPLTAVLVPLGFLALVSGLWWPALGKILALPLSWLTLGLLHVVGWFARIGQLNYRIPAPPVGVTIVFFVLLLGLMISFRVQFARQRMVVRS